MRTPALVAALVGCLIVGGIVEQDVQDAHAERRSVLADYLPYYGQDAPDWCAEDMACWIGSSADDRDDSELLRDLPADLRASRDDYGIDAPGTVFWDQYPEDLIDSQGRSHAGCVVLINEPHLLVCPDGHVETS